MPARASRFLRRSLALGGEVAGVAATAARKGARGFIQVTVATRSDGSVTESVGDYRKGPRVSCRNTPTAH
ncbi:MAG: hypothetical protein ACLGIK_06325, partial [Gemmatimonadota bacterium]